MKEPTYRDALAHGWHLMIHHKILWIFGLFAALLGQMGVLEIFTRVIVTIKYYTYYPVVTHAPLLWNAFVESTKQWNLPVDQKVWLGWLAFIIVAFIALFVFVAVITQGALIHYVSQYIQGKEKMASHEGWHAGVRHFWRLFFLQIIKKIGISLLVLFVGGATYNFILYTSTLTTMLFVFSILFALFLGSVLSLLVTYAAGYIVVENMNLRPALSSAIVLLKSHAFVSVEVAVLMLAANVVVAIVAVIFVFLFQLEVAFVAMLSLASNSLALWSIGTTFSSLILTVLLIGLASFMMVYSTAVWTYLFMKMHRHGLVPRLKLLFARSRP